MEITRDIIYIGVNDHRIDLFEGQYKVPNGMSYNSYLILDEKTAVMDTVDRNFTHEWLDNLGKGLNGRKPDYLVFGSAGCVRAWTQFRGILDGTVPVCIGAYTEAELKRHFGGRSLTAGSYTADGIAEAILADMEDRVRPEDGEV